MDLAPGLFRVAAELEFPLNLGCLGAQVEALGTREGPIENSCRYVPA